MKRVDQFNVTKLVIAVLFVFLAQSCNHSETASDLPETAIAKQVNKSWWQLRHQNIVDADKSKVQLLFLGDSITQQWEDEKYGLSIWQQYYEEGLAFNMGMDSDKTQNLLWRIENGELEGTSPQLAVLMIGTNNSKSDSGEDIAVGINLIIETILTKLPETTLVVHRIFSRGDHDNPTRISNDKASEIIALREAHERVIIVDINAHFEDENGDVPEDIMHDHLHLTTKGYQIWANGISEYVTKYVN